MEALYEAPTWWLGQRDAVVWWVTALVIGFAAAAPAFVFFRSLPDRGYAFAKVLGLVLLSYTLWIGGYIHVLPFGRVTIIGVLVVMAAGSVWLLRRHRPEFGAYVRERWPYMLAVEGLFTLAFAVAIYLRAFVPEIDIPEKTADFAFVNGILQSDYFPPRDPWMSGHSISWYYFGHLNVATLTELTAIPSRITFNLSIALIVALSATGVFGIVYNLVAARARRQAILYGLAGVVFLLLLANIIGVVEVLAANGFGSEGFYKTLDINGISKPLDSPKWYPTEWWWIVHSVQIATGWDGREFPFFTFLQGDMHAHMMVMPFNFLALGAVLEFWRSEYLPLPQRRRARRAGDTLSALSGGLSRAFNGGVGFWRHNPLRLAVLGVAVGATGFVELWALPAYLLLLLLVPLARRYVRDGRLTLGAFEDALAFGVPPVVLAIVAFSPFYIDLKSVSDGVQPIEILHTGFVEKQARVTFPHHFLYQWLPHIWLLASLGLVALAVVRGRPGTRRGGGSDSEKGRPWVSVLASVWPALAPLGLWAVLVLLKRGPGGFLDEVSERSWTWLTILIIGALLVLTLVAFRWQAKRAQAGEDRQGVLFVLMVVGAAMLILLGIEFFWVQDPFGARFNTVFRLGFQVWILLSVALAYALYFVVSHWPIRTPPLLAGKVLWGSVTAVILLAALIYPLAATLWRTGEFKGAQTLDGLNYVKTWNNDGYQAFEWVKKNTSPGAVVLEAVGKDYQAGRGQVSAVTGRQTILGWPWHECRWRALSTCVGDPPSAPMLDERTADIQTIYSTTDLSQASALLDRYDVDYVYVGPEERKLYGDAGVAKFQSSFEAVYTSAGVTIYRVPDNVQNLARQP